MYIINYMYNIKYIGMQFREQKIRKVLSTANLKSIENLVHMNIEETDVIIYIYIYLIFNF